MVTISRPDADLIPYNLNSASRIMNALVIREATESGRLEIGRFYTDSILLVAGVLEVRPVVLPKSKNSRLKLRRDAQYRTMHGHFIFVMSKPASLCIVDEKCLVTEHAAPGHGLAL